MFLGRGEAIGMGEEVKEANYSSPAATVHLVLALSIVQETRMFVTNALEGCYVRAYAHCAKTP